MSNVIRVFVEKRDGFDVEARHMLDDLRDNLGMTAIRSLRLLNRYDVEGLTAEEFEQALVTVFSERTTYMTRRSTPERDGVCSPWSIFPDSTISAPIRRPSASSCSRRANVPVWRRPG